MYIVFSSSFVFLNGKRQKEISKNMREETNLFELSLMAKSKTYVKKNVRISRMKMTIFRFVKRDDLHFLKIQFMKACQVP